MTATMSSALPPIPPKRYFAIGEVSDLCAVKPHVLRYWEKEFPSLKPDKRRGNRRYYRMRDVLLVRNIRSMLYDQGLTIDGARRKLAEAKKAPPAANVREISALARELEEVIGLL